MIATEPTRELSRTESPKPSFHVLVVDDDEDIRESLAEILKEDGFGVLTASNGREALEVLYATPTKPSVILLDMMMPVMNGSEFREVQKNDSELASIPVAIFSADASAGQAAALVEAAAFLKKPLNLDELLETLDSLCLRDS